VKGETALLTFGIGPVHTFIAQARRIADVWAGSYLLSHLVRQAISELLRDRGGEMVFPWIESEALIPDGLPNRFVCRVPAAQAREIAEAMRARVERFWELLVQEAVGVLAEHGLRPAADLWTAERMPGVLRQTDRLLDISWSWVPESAGYAEAALAGARRFAAARLFQPFVPVAEHGQKCAICGQRSALPNGNPEEVQEAWTRASQKAENDPTSGLARFLRLDQGRLCLVCATKRLFAYLEFEGRRRSSFLAFDRFQPSEEAPYFALVKVDGDRMSRLLGLPPGAIRGGDLESFHREVSQALTRFASGLQTDGSPDLNLRELGSYEVKGNEPPQLIYAGGDDVLFVCDPRDALPLVSRLRDRYQAAFPQARALLVDPGDREPFTLSAGVLFAHAGHPAGLLLSDLEALVKEGAKARAGRDAVAIRLDKRGGAPVEVTFSWSDAQAPNGGWLAALDRLVDQLREGVLSSGQTFSLRLEERTLQGVFTTEEQWRLWLADRLSRRGGAAESAEGLAAEVTPFFVRERTEALRIARFLGREVER
jgi:CRISPR-associated protein Cmr2